MKQNTIKTIEDTGIVGVLRGIVRDDLVIAENHIIAVSRGENVAARIDKRTPLDENTVHRVS